MMLPLKFMDMAHCTAAEHPESESALCYHQDLGLSDLGACTYLYKDFAPTDAKNKDKFELSCHSCVVAHLLLHGMSAGLVALDNGIRPVSFL
jgi:hypothetical protein